MLCPFCRSSDTRVLDSRTGDGGQKIRRRRECLDPECAQRFTTYERASLKLPVILKRNKVRQAFDSDKLLRSIQLAVQNRPVSESVLERMHQKVINRAQAHPENDLESALLGRWVLDELRNNDQIACILYASVFEKIKTIRQWRQLLEREESALPESLRERQQPLFGDPGTVDDE